MIAAVEHARHVPPSLACASVMREITRPVPFTPTHALAAVPLARIRGLVPSALAIGCMLPDVAMFLPATPSYETTHSWRWGAFSCLPYGLLAFVLFRLCRARAIGFAPRALRARLAPFAASDLRMKATTWLGVALSITLGVWTHILWDGFTHAHRLGSELVPELMTPWLAFAGHEIRGYRLLQHASSVIGLPLMAGVVSRWYRGQPEQHELVIPAASFAQRVLAGSWLVAAPLVAAVWAWNRFDPSQSRALTLLAFHIVTRTIGAYLVGAVLMTFPRPAPAGRSDRY